MKLKIAIGVGLLLCLTNCSLKYVAHPGSANTFDSVAYDSLHDVQTIIDTARAQFDSGALSPSVKPLLNKLVDAYNIANPAWKAYHDAALKNPKTDQTQLENDLNALSAALLAFRKGK